MNIHRSTVDSFGDEWDRFDQSELEAQELQSIFSTYFHLFPWDDLPDNAEGFDMGCGSGRWARLVAPRVGLLNLIDASPKALAVARRTLAAEENTRFHLATPETSPLPPGSQDFGYSLGVLHHIPDTQAALRACVGLLKPGAPFLVYLYYRFDSRPIWFRALWRASESLRAVVSRLPSGMKALVSDCLAVAIYLPLSRLSRIGEGMGFDMRNMPLYAYRSTSFYTMRTDSRDRFGTPLEQRFTRAEIAGMMERCGLNDVVFSNREPYWVAIGIKA
jgi:SAM-dependent methyltransferase